MKPVFSQFPVFELETSLFPALRENDLAPERVWAQGTPEALKRLDLLPERGLGIVGSRLLQVRTERHVRSTILELRGQNLIVISGLALGVDSVAHLAALEAGLPTIAVLAHGLHEIYPVENEGLARRILENDGLLFSQYPLGQASNGEAFLARNRWIAAFSKAVWVAQAAWRSGALNTARHARELSRGLYATPCFPGDPALSGNEKLFNQAEASPLRDALDLGTTWLELVSALSDLRKPRRKQVTVLSRVRDLTMTEGLPLLSALHRLAVETKRPYDAVLLDFEREMTQNARQ